MLKTLNNNDVVITPFITTKDWEVSNTNNEDVIVMEHSGSAGLPVAVEYLIYGPNAVTSSNSSTTNCDIANEKQSDDLLNYRSGLNISGLFYPSTDPINLDGTYQRLVYSQISNMFYNNYNDPTKMWGLEQIDFELSKTKRFISDEFKMFEVPRILFGEKITINNVILFDNTTDNSYIITDDGNCNLFAGNNIFSKQQELGNYSNTFSTSSSTDCNYYQNSFTVWNTTFDLWNVDGLTWDES